ncbi:response regulator [Paenactinomyces guangxiensis]|uniref:Response regulator n=1 Tax=Paenactinomyces guangxiensis TaxID=1490290 RepID=A0A7W2A9I4_9BACL|nr:response regulator [Paenactinomyces guangxiensis]MBA4495227.1 response regulator [Paenactinomyces guangxiensis]MBH8592311.1 response regulator [Paenactinomyces guangxiensis]
MKEKILLVDDEAGLLEMIKTFLIREGYEQIECATTGAEAIRLVKQELFDLILLDVMLPDMNGFDVCQEMRKFTCRRSFSRREWLA